ncbi:MAG: DUF72 domain-containing protein, partial [Bdellovibrio sp.]
MRLASSKERCYRPPVEFGKLDNVDNVKWTLPPDVPSSIEFLRTHFSLTKGTQFYIGTPAWGRKEWLGKIYPAQTKPAEYLSYYAQNFNTIELNTSHYRIPNREQTEKWKSQVTPDFVFCPKVFQGISHSSAGLLDKKLLQEWYTFLENLGDSHRGPCFIQFPPSFDYGRKAALFHFLEQWPSDFELSLEFRHPSWFQAGALLPALEKYLQSKKFGTVITDVAGRRDVLHTSVTSSFAMLRFIGNDLHPSDFTRASDWA